MSAATTATIAITLDGDWSMTGVATQLQPLAEHLAALSHHAPGGRPGPSGQPLISLAGIDAIDACGLQLLTVFIRHLRQLGFAPTLTNVDHDFRLTVQTLGFAHELEQIIHSDQGHA